MKFRTRLAAVLLLLAAFSTVSYGESPYPSRPITLVVQGAAGGGNDVLARRFAEQMQKKLGQPVVVDNRSGGGGAIGSDYVSRATPDGYTLLLMTAGETYYKALNPNVRFDVQADFTPITLLSRSPLILAVSTKLPVKDFPGFISYAKAHPGELSYGSAGIGTPHHLAGEMLKQAAGFDMVHVAYRGTGPALQDLLAGQIPVVWCGPAVAEPYVRSGKLKLLALADSTRLPYQRDIPTIAESGYPQVVMDNWFGIVGPKGLPADIVKRINDTLQEVGRDAHLNDALAMIGLVPILQGPAEFKARIASDHARYTALAERIKARQ